MRTWSRGTEVKIALPSPGSHVFIVSTTAERVSSDQCWSSYKRALTVCPETQKDTSAASHLPCQELPPNLLPLIVTSCPACGISTRPAGSTSGQQYYILIRWLKSTGDDNTGREWDWGPSPLCYLNGSNTGLESTSQMPWSQVPPASIYQGPRRGMGPGCGDSEQSSEDEGLREQSGLLGPWFPSRLGKWHPKARKLCLLLSGLEYSFFHWLVLILFWGGGGWSNKCYWWKFKWKVMWESFSLSPD